MEKIVLTGFMGTGKTVAGRRLARRLDLPFYDLDDVIEARAWRSIAEIFRDDGEVAFRTLEAEVVAATRPLRECVLATGGGAILRAENLAAFREGGVVVGLMATPDAILARVGEAKDRPLLAGGDRRAQLHALLAAREPAYARADLRVDTTDLDPDAVAARVAAWLGVRLAEPKTSDPGGMGVLTVPLPQGSYQVHIGVGLLPRAGAQIAALGLGPRAAVVTDQGVPPGHVEILLAGLREAGLHAACLAVPSGEGAKSLEQVARLYDGFVAARLDRGSVVVALGGGVVGDLAGYAAATFLRGLALVQVPTTLLAQVDSSVGGKVGVNLPQGKNLVGAFHQPRLVVADVAALGTLPAREFRSGLAEVVKYGMIADPGLFDLLEREADSLAPGAADLLVPIVQRCCRIKAQVVALDEREQGWRAILNFGHTLGHAVEAAAGYGGLTHGEAVAIGMAAAARLSVARGICPPADLERLRRLLGRLGLPVGSPLSFEAARPYLAVDKKGRAGVRRFVLTRGIADVTLAPIHDDGDLQNALETVS